MLSSNIIYAFFLVNILGNGNAKPSALFSDLNAISSTRTGVQASQVDRLLHPSLGGGVNSIKKPFLNRQKRRLETRTTPAPRGIALDVDICLDLSITVLGIKVLNLAAVIDLGLRINQHGISARELTLIQANVASQLAASAKVATNSFACTSACNLASKTCQSHSFNTATRKCTLVPKQLSSTSDVIANLIGSLSLLGSSSPEYCGICPNQCTSQPTSLGRYKKRNQLSLGLCPSGLDACPINSTSLTQGYECIDTQEEMESCGGCSSTGDGIDCTTLPGVEVPGCAIGRCVALSCKSGYQLTEDSTCVPKTTNILI